MPLPSRPKSDAKATALVVGNPDFHGWAAQLPGAEAEADEVCKRLQVQSGTTYLSGGEATKASVIGALGACDYVHLATPGAADTPPGEAGQRVGAGLVPANAQGRRQPAHERPI